MTCPYCNTEEDCEHLLLVADTTWRTFEAGVLLSAIEGFREWLGNQYPDTSDDGLPSEVEHRLFELLLDLAASLADSEEKYGLHDRPGLSQDYRVLYCSTEERVNEAYQSFERECMLSVQQNISLLMRAAP